MTNRTCAVILAGGCGKRLNLLTKHRAKPAVPFGGVYRIIDFVLTNFINSGLRRKVFVVIQYAPASLSTHIQNFWIHLMGWRESIEVLQPKMRTESEERYSGTADAVFQNWDSICKDKDDKRVAIFSGDHVYVMDVSQMIKFHKANRSEFTICANIVSIEDAAENLGVIKVDTNNRIIDFVEKPLLHEVPEIPNKKGFCYASMGNYIAEISNLQRYLVNDSLDPLSEHDFGKNIIPTMLKNGLPLYAYPFSDNLIENQEGCYWEDVGTLPKLFKANLETLHFVPPLNLNNEKWPIPINPDARILGEDAKVIHSSLSSGVVVDDALVRWSTIGPNVTIEKRASVITCQIFEKVVVGHDSYLKNVICDKNVIFPPNTVVGVNRDDDDKHFYTESLNDIEWITVIPKNYKF
jgi:glucose-1-phosphate adenylyltransferase